MRLVLIISAAVLLFARSGNLTELDMLVAAVLCLLLVSEMAERDKA